MRPLTASRRRPPAVVPGLRTSTLAVCTLLGLGISSLAPQVAQAELLLIDGQVRVRTADVPTPTRGMTMRSVEERFGAPENRAPTVGQPPITRWDYPGFSVYFEHDRVLHSVVRGS
jgi:hypothetical protein